MEYTDRTLFFVCPVFEGIFENRAYNIHTRCLKYYSKYFKDAIIIIDKTNDVTDETVNGVIDFFVSLGIPDIRFKIRNQTLLYESKAFYEDILLEIDSFKHNTFFGHLKGATNYRTNDKDVIDEWLLGMYFQCLNNPDELEWCLTLSPNTFYGSFLTYNHDKSDFTTVDGGQISTYAGTFFWFNPNMLKYKFRTTDVPTNRWYAEGWMDRNLSDFEKPSPCYKSRYMNDINMYCDAIEANQFILDDDYDKFLEFKKEILEGL